MPRLVFTQRFARKVKKLDPQGRAAVERALSIFCEDARRPGLNFERVKSTEYHTIRVSRGDRIFLRRVSEDEFDVVDVGGHDLYRTYG